MKQQAKEITPVLY